MRRALAAELMKIRTTKMWWGLLLGLLVLVGLQAAFTAAYAGSTPGPGAPPLPPLQSSEGLKAALSAGFQSGYLFALVLGTIIGAVDFRHRTATQTFLATAHRSRVVAAKVAASAIYGLLYALAAQALSIAVVASVAAIRGIDVAFGDRSVVQSLALGLPGITLWCIIGVSLGVLLRNQIAAVLIAVGFVFVIDPLLGLAFGQLGVDTVAKFTVTNASTALVQGYSPNGLLSWWAGGLVLLGYGIVIAVAGWVLTRFRDIT